MSPPVQPKVSSNVSVRRENDRSKDASWTGTNRPIATTGENGKGNSLSLQASRNVAAVAGIPFAISPFVDRFPSRDRLREGGFRYAVATQLGRILEVQPDCGARQSVWRDSQRWGQDRLPPPAQEVQ